MERLRELAEEISITLDDKMLADFATYYEMLIEKNKVMNLTAITEKDEVITKHFIDSLALCCVYPVIANPDYKIKVLDLGTGAGFPGIPLKIAFPHIEIVLMDSLNKRVKFLEEVKDELKMSGIYPVHGRAEEAARNNNYREGFDLCVSRAVANLATLSEYCLPFVKTDGLFISYKSSEIDDEVSDARYAIGKLGGKLSSVKKVSLPDSDIERSFVFIDKIKTTPKEFPRKAGTAGKNPLGNSGKN